MAEDNLFTKVKNAIRGQKSSFCSRSTSVTPLETIDPTDKIRYIDCDGKVTEIPYEDINNNGGYIPDCVQGGSPIDNDVSVKLFVQYGTTDCNTPPPSSNIIVISCDKGDSFVVNPSGFTLTKERVYNLSFNNNNIGDGCYTIGDTTSQGAIDSIKNEPESIISCLECKNPA
jgi:hypothetical protein